MRRGRTRRRPLALIHRPIRRCANSALFVVICARPVLQSLFPLPIGRSITRPTHTRALAVFGGLSLINSRYFLKAFFSASIEGNISRILNLAIRFLSLGSRDSSLNEEKIVKTFLARNFRSLSAVPLRPCGNDGICSLSPTAHQDRCDILIEVGFQLLNESQPKLESLESAVMDSMATGPLDNSIVWAGRLKTN